MSSSDNIVSGQASSLNRVPVFLCYRQADGRRTAEKLYSVLSERPGDGSLATSTFPPLDVYFDQTAPGVADWTEIHQPFLERAKAFIVVCTPGSKIDEGPHDWVYKEISWWIENRETAPILIDALGEGTRYVPQPVATKWPNAQRVELIAEDWEALQRDDLDRARSRMFSRIIGAITYSRDNVYRQELLVEQERRRELQAALTKQRLLSRRLMFALLVLGAMGVALLGAAGVAWWLKGIAGDAAKRAEGRLSDLYLDTGLKSLADGDDRQGVAYLCASLRANPSNRVAAARVAFELRYRDWLLSNNTFPLPAELLNLDANLDEIAARKAKFSGGSGDIEVTTLTREGRVARTFRVSRQDGIWTKLDDNRKRSEANDPDDNKGFPDFGNLTEEYDFLSGDRFVSNDGNWAAEIDGTEVSFASQPVKLLNLGNHSEIVPKHSEEGHDIMAGIPAFDPRRPVVWLHADFSFVQQDFSKLDSFFWLEAIELPTGRRLVDQRLRPRGGREDGRPPKVSDDGTRIVIRYDFEQSWRGIRHHVVGRHGRRQLGC